MIEDNTTWYLGTVVYNVSYKLAKYTDATGTTLTTSTTTAKVGLLRLGELMSGQFDRYSVKGVSYWTLTPDDEYMRVVVNNGHVADDLPSNACGVRPSVNLKSNVVITGGDGTKERPFTLALQ